MKSIHFFAIFSIFITGLLPARTTYSVPGDFANLQDAVDRASEGDVISLSAGEYYGYTVINKSLTIRGAGKDKTILYYSDETPQPSSPGIMKYARVADPVLRINTDGKVLVKDLEIRGALEGFLHYGTTPFGIISDNAELELHEVKLRRLGNIAVWVNRGSLLAVDVDFADNMGFRSQSDLGFHLTNLSRADFVRFNQLQSNIDHSININDYPDGDGEERRTEVNITDSTIVASALFWGDCVRAYGAADITIDNTSFSRNPGGEPPRNIGNTGISFNGHRNTLHLKNSSFKNMVEGIRLMTLPGGDQFYQLIIENTIFDTFDTAPFVITGTGRAEIDLGGGPLGSKGNNSFLPVGESIIENRDSTDLTIHYPVDKENTTDVDVRLEDLEEVRISGTEIQLFVNEELIRSTDLVKLLPLKAVLTDSQIALSYRYSEGDYYLGLFSKDLQFITEYHMGDLEIIDFVSDENIIVCHYKNPAGTHYVGAFSPSLSFLGEYWFYNNVTVLEINSDAEGIKVLYRYESGKRFYGYFDSKMGFLRAESAN